MSKFIERRTPILSKKQSVLDLALTQRSAGDGQAIFNVEDQEYGVEVAFNIKDFQAMGSPEVITVTIEPGNQMNAEPGEHDQHACGNPSCDC